jgi:hypothetical protein
MPDGQTSDDRDTVGKDTLNALGNNYSMAKQERRLVLLNFLADTKLAMPIGVIYRNLRYHVGITFSRPSIRNYLNECLEEGLVRRVKPEPLEARKLVDLDRGDERGGYWIITKTGREYVRYESERELSFSASA